MEARAKLRAGRRDDGRLHTQPEGSSTVTPMIKVHHLDHSRSKRVLWRLEELGEPYEVVTYRRGKDLLAPPEAAPSPSRRETFHVQRGLGSCR